jgi:hypothetical protein
MQARNIAPIRPDISPDKLNHIFSQPRFPHKNELMMCFPNCINNTTTLRPTLLELRQHRSQRSPRHQHFLQPAHTVYIGYSKKPTLLINLSLLVDADRWSQVQCPCQVPAKSGIQHLCSLQPYFRLGVFCDWQEVPARAATSCLNLALYATLHHLPANGTNEEVRIHTNLGA